MSCGSLEKNLSGRVESLSPAEQRVRAVRDHPPSLLKPTFPSQPRNSCGLVGRSAPLASDTTATTTNRR